MDFKLLKTLCQIHAPSGNEVAMKEFILNYVEVNASKWKTKPEVIFGDEFQDCANCPVMIVVPSGSFSMGGPPVDQGRPYTEGELRPVHIPKHFASGKFEITYKEWDACVIDKQCPEAKKDEWSDSTHPVVNISWKEAFQYTKWLSKKTKRPYRLLT